MAGSDLSHKNTKMKLRPFHVSFLMLVAALAPMMLLPLVRADKSFDAWNAAEPTRRKAAELRKTDPKAAAQLVQQALNQVSDPNVAADFYTLLASIQTNDLKQPDEALKLLDFALPLFQKAENKVPPHHWMTMVAAKANALAAQKKGVEAEAFLKENWPLLVQASQSANAYSQRAARDTLQAYAAALAAQDKEAQFTQVLGQFLRHSPQFLNFWPGNTENWLLTELQSRLQKQEKWDEALSWAKLSYQLAPFDKKEIERSTQTLNKIWAAREDFAAAGVFSRAQTDAALPNPLAKVPLPPLSDEGKAILQKWIADMEGRQVVEFRVERTRDIVKARIALGTPGDLSEAMKTAVKLLKEHPESQEGSLLVCRVFKAADSNLIRANAFLSYMGGEGANPIPEFLEEMKNKKP